MAAIEYRLSGEALFPACLHDVKAAVRWLRRFGSELGPVPTPSASGASLPVDIAAFLGLNNSSADLDGAVGVTDVSADVQAAVAWYAPTTFLAMDADARSEGRGDRGSHDAPDSPESRLIGRSASGPSRRGTIRQPYQSRSSPAPLRSCSSMGWTTGRSPWSERPPATGVDGGGRRRDPRPRAGAGHVFAGIDPSGITARSADFLADRLGASVNNA